MQTEIEFVLIYHVVNKLIDYCIRSILLSVHVCDAETL